MINGNIASSLLVKTTEIRLKQLQAFYWLYENPLTCWPTQLNNLRHDNFLGNIILYYLQSNISFTNTNSNTNKFTIKGGKTPLQNIIPWKKKWIGSLRHKSILFFDQLICNGVFLSQFRDLAIQINNDHHIVKGSYPQWFSYLEKTILINSVHSNKIKDQYIITPFTPSGFKTSSPLDSNKVSDWVALWIPPESNYYNLPYPGQTILRKSFKSPLFSDKVLFQHFVPSNLTADPRSPSKKQNILTAYNGCTFNNNLQRDRLPIAAQRLFCGNLVDIDLPQLIQTNYFTSINSEKLYLLKRNIKTVSDQATQRYLDMRPNVIPNHIILNNFLPFCSIESFIPISSTRLLLNQFKLSLKDETILTFYTDGSHKFFPHFTSPSSHLSSAFLLIHDKFNIDFTTAIPSFWANSTNAEIFALLLVLLICPSNSEINVCTDSLTLIHLYNKIHKQNAFNYSSLMFKIPFNVYWSFIFKLIDERNISLILKKVAAHSDDPFNNKVDQLAKSSLMSSPIPLTFKQTPYFSYIPTFNHMPILTTLRPFLKDYTNTKQFIDFYYLKRNSKYSQLQINWSLTFDFIKLGTPTETSFKESRAHCRRLKFLFEQIPTIEFMKATQPTIYNSSWMYCRCNTDKEYFNHIWTCPKAKIEMKQIIIAALNILKNQLFIHTS